MALNFGRSILVAILLIILWIQGPVVADTCYHEIFGYHGAIQSRNFRPNLRNGELCTWVISTFSGFQLQLMFDVPEDLEDRRLCENSYIILYDGPNKEDKILGRFCGNSFPKLFVSSKNAIRIDFYSNDSDFVAHYISSICGYNFRQEEGVFESPSYPIGYPGPIQCVWTIETRNDRQVSLTIESIQVTNSSDCSTEYLQIWSGGEYLLPSGILLATLCQRNGVMKNNLLFKDIRSPMNKLYIVFVSSSSAQSLHFKARFESVHCGGHLEKDEGSFSSMGYPVNYVGGVSCIWSITVSEGYQIALNLSFFQIPSAQNCTSGYLDIRDGLYATSPPLMDRLCGSEVPDLIRSSSNHMWVHYKPISNSDFLGFFAKFEKDIDECSNMSAQCQNICENTIGSYKCSCPDGYSLGINNHSCHDVDECTDNSHLCTHLCVNTEGSYECSCPMGYLLQNDSQTCIDIDECSNGSSQCQHHCENTLGSYKCFCFNGHELQADNRSCSDVDECASNEHGCEKFCRNLDGSYECYCKDGYRLQIDRRTCGEEHSRVVYYYEGNEKKMFKAGQAEFGINLKGKDPVESTLAIVEPRNGCSEITNDIKGKIAVIERGHCYFVKKARYVEKAGAIGGIIIDNTAGSSAASTTMLSISGDYKNDVNIPIVFIYHVEGSALLLEHGKNPNITVGIGDILSIPGP